MKKKLLLIMMGFFYFVAGVNHFRNPEAYYKIIPPYLPWHSFINIVSGVCEIGFAILLFIPATRKFACYGIILMLIAFIPTHIYMLGSCWMIKGECMPQWLLWVRLLALQPLFIYWAWKMKD
ncbi:MAG: MauE/DoxX family redox-associated membrane protein [Ferruginibacter sp.]